MVFSHNTHFHITDGGMGGDLQGTPPKKNLSWGTVHASVPQIFQEVVLSDACESTN